MTTTQTKSAERRKAERHARSLRISWRVLGDCHFRFGEAVLKDIGTNGLALQVDRLCPKGTLVIVQFEEAEERFCEPMLLQTVWSRALQPTKTGPQTYLMGCSFTSPLGEKDLKALMKSAKKAASAQSHPKETPTKTPVQLNPVPARGAGEKRSLLRRGGFAVRVVLCRAEGGTPIEASVVDRSLKGLGILIHQPFTKGTLLTVRPRDAHEKILSAEVQVRNCRPKDKHWFLGCHFSHTPPAKLLMLLG